jgi:hypothetical protein
MVHHHHHIEETFLFPIYNEKLGEHAMDNNIDQHHAFMDGLNDLESYFKKVHAGTTTYSGKTVIEKLNGFADALVLHLAEVCWTVLHLLYSFTLSTYLSGNSNPRIGSLARSIHRERPQGHGSPAHENHPEGCVFCHDATHGLVVPRQVYRSLVRFPNFPNISFCSQ